MSNLLNTVDGRNALLVAQKHLLERRLSRFFKRNLVIDIEKYRTGGNFDLETMLGQLNPAQDAELLMIYQLLGAVGGLSVTYSDLEYHIDPVAGSDVTGLGTAAKPYASSWFLDNLPRRIAHKVRILIHSSLSEPTRDVELNFDFVSREACFSILGVGAPTVTFDNQAIDAIGETQLRPDGGVYLDILTLGPLAHNQFLQSKGGAPGNGKTAPIYSAVLGAGVVTKQLQFSGTAAGDLYRVVVPSVEWTVRSFNSFCRGEIHRSNFSNRGAPLVLMNLDISFQGEVFPFPNIRNCSWKNNCSSVISFVRFNNQMDDMLIQGGDINMINAVDDTLEAKSACGVTNLNNGTAGLTPNICGFMITIGASASNRVTVKDCTIRGIHANVGIALMGGRERFEFSWAYVWKGYRTFFELYSCIATGEHIPPGNFGAGITTFGCIAKIERVCVIDSDAILRMEDGSQVRSDSIGSDLVFSAITNFGASFYGINELMVETLGATGTPTADGFNGPAADDLACWQESSASNITAAWPAVDVATTVNNTRATIIK